MLQVKTGWFVLSTRQKWGGVLSAVDKDRAAGFSKHPSNREGASSFQSQSELFSARY